jgi:hypothetical protein
MSRELHWAALREVAVAAQADPRTVQRVLRGENVRGSVRDRIERALAERAAASTGSDSKRATANHRSAV